MLGTTKLSENSVHNPQRQDVKALTAFVSAPHFSQPISFFTSSPYQRPSRAQDITERIISSSLERDQLSSNHHLLAQRILLNIYEQDLVFLPKAPLTLDLHEFKSFYDPALVACGKTIRPALEKYLYHWLEQEIHVNGPWCLDSFIAHTHKVLDDIAHSDSKLYSVLTHSSNPQRAAKFFLTQCAGDFLSEASAMARNVLGNGGEYTSELFKILIDEYGYGIDKRKHSTIFEDLLKELDMPHHVHHYWQFYTAGSLSLTNYFHYVSANHGELFRYIGAMYYTEATLALTTRHQSRAVKEIFNGCVSTEYFDEHNHIDVHHGRMALQRLIIPMIKQFGDKIIPDLIRGFEEFKLLQDIADEELYAHIKWHDELDIYRAQATALYGNRPPDSIFTETKNELSVLHTHANDELFWVESGELNFVVSPELSVQLKAGEGIVIPKGMIHGTYITSNICTYTVTAL
ncbi:hypothetical protein PS723_03012 [Pseudomonas fluorescens]|uniref:Cupin type-2 domain-containing protein n=1 Tax=Pseudomonas fluorescens TaxID=294 RepID=A0A5E7CLH0_PSEFL|nr:hypothetical protein PS723_03012 [Pseudomonas fluorescens]